MSIARLIVAALLALPMATSGVLSAQDGGFMTTNEIRSLIAGRPMTFSGTYSGMTFTGEAKWDADGAITGRTFILGIPHDWEGTWHVRDNLYCRTLTSEGRSDTKCHRVRKVGPRTIQFVTPDGTVTSTTVVK